MAPDSFAQDSYFDLDERKKKHELSAGLFEISGLAIASDSSVYAHNDEHSIIYEIDIESGETLSAFAIGTPTLAADFEGIAVDNGRIYLTTSDGLLYESLIGAHQSRQKFNAYDTGVGSFCEVEGLTMGPPHPAGGKHFLILCKSPRQDEMKDRLTIFSWNLNERLPVEVPWLSVERDGILTQQEQKKFRPSGIEWIDQTQQLIVISGRNNQYIRLDKAGEVIAKAKLTSKQHPQAEGLAVMPSGELVIADEGSPLQPGQLSIYGP